MSDWETYQGLVRMPDGRSAADVRVSAYRSRNTSINRQEIRIVLPLWARQKLELDIGDRILLRVNRTKRLAAIIKHPRGTVRLTTAGRSHCLRISGEPYGIRSSHSSCSVAAYVGSTGQLIIKLPEWFTEEA